MLRTHQNLILFTSNLNSSTRPILIEPRLNLKHSPLCLPDSLDLPIDFVSDKHLWISIVPWHCFVGLVKISSLWIWSP